IPVTITKSNSKGNINGLDVRLKDKFLPEKLLKIGNAINTKTIANTKAIDVSIIDSNKNCRTNSAFIEPNTLRIPTSLARLEAPAVERFIKFIHAISSIKNAMALKIYTYLISPSGSRSFVKSEWR